MPCYDGRTAAEERAEYEASRERERNTLLKEYLHNSPAAEMLCYVLRELEEAEEPVKIQHLPANIHKWWEEHKIRDAEKAKNDAIREKDLKRKALAKLSDEEKKVLGL